MSNIEAEPWVMPTSRYRSDYILRIGYLTARERLVLLAVDAHDGPQGCIASNRRLGEIIGLKESVVKKDITEIRRKEFIMDIGGSALHRRADLSSLGVPADVWSKLRRSHSETIAEVCAQNPLSARQKLLLFVVYVTMHPNKYQVKNELPGCDLTNELLAQRIAVTKRSVTNDVARLCEEGWLESNGIRGRGRRLWFRDARPARESVSGNEGPPTTGEAELNTKEPHTT